jgi:hypothetical protein
VDTTAEEKKEEKINSPSIGGNMKPIQKKKKFYASTNEYSVTT